MVFKLLSISSRSPSSFENDVKMYGIQTISFLHVTGFMFENDVKMYGIQTIESRLSQDWEFENDVKMYGIQTPTPFSPL